MDNWCTRATLVARSRLVGDVDVQKNVAIKLNYSKKVKKNIYLFFFFNIFFARNRVRRFQGQDKDFKEEGHVYYLQNQMGLNDGILRPMSIE